jgi:hypothetical protein
MKSFYVSSGCFAQEMFLHNTKLIGLRRGKHTLLSTLVILQKAQGLIILWGQEHCPGVRRPGLSSEGPGPIGEVPNLNTTEISGQVSL